jgi:NADPH2:quinone reductase
VRQLVEWFDAGKVRPAVSERVPLDEAPAAMNRLIQRRVKGKIVILPEA